jgi:nudix-type nucleoside diphosphatase (YffH/AdpP family)
MDFEIKNQKRILDGFIKVDELQVEFDRFDQQGRNLVKRFNLERPEAAAVILENVSNNSVIVVEQFRFAVASKPNQNAWIIEIIAGLVDPGETPIEAAYRETLEESGYQVKQLEHLYTFYASIGISNENVHIFYGQVTDADKIEKGGGLEIESEDLKIHEIPISELVEMLKKGEIRDSKTIMGIQWLASKKQIPL